MFVYTRSEKATRDNDFHEVWTVGHYKPDGSWVPESDHPDKETAAYRVHYLNGGCCAHLVKVQL